MRVEPGIQAQDGGNELGGCGWFKEMHVRPLLLSSHMLQPMIVVDIDYRVLAVSYNTLQQQRLA